MKGLSTQSILCFDDDKDNCDLLTFVFKQEGFEVVSCKSVDDFSKEIRKRKFNAVILENHFGQAISNTVCKEIKRVDQTLPIIFYSCEGRKTEIEKALAAGGDAYLTKPSDFDKLTETVLKFVEGYELK
jgi:DNA-binding response OmpR family regulator